MRFGGLGGIDPFLRRVRGGELHRNGKNIPGAFLRRSLRPIPILVLFREVSGGEWFVFEDSERD